MGCNRKIPFVNTFFMFNHRPLAVVLARIPTPSFFFGAAQIRRELLFGAEFDTQPAANPILAESFPLSIERAGEAVLLAFDEALAALMPRLGSAALAVVRRRGGTAARVPAAVAIASAAVASVVAAAAAAAVAVTWATAGASAVTPVVAFPIAIAVASSITLSVAVAAVPACGVAVAAAGRRGRAGR